MDNKNIPKEYIDRLINSDPRFGAVMQLPDENFEKAYKGIKEAFSSIYNSPEVIAAAKNSSKTLGKFDKEENEKLLDEMLKEIDNLEDYSDLKKQFLKEIISESAKLTMEVIENPRDKVKVKIYKLNPDAIIPTYAHPTDAGADISAVEEVKIEAGETKLVPTGLAIAIPAGYEVQIRPRSGLSLKTGLRIANAPGTVDAEYRGELGIIMTNTGDIPYVIDKGMKIAQMLIAPTPMIEFEEVPTKEDLGSTNRGAGGFGSTDAES